DHVVDPGKQHMAAMAHLALDRAAGPRLVILELAAKFGDLALGQYLQGEMVAALAIVRHLALAQGFRHRRPPSVVPLSLLRLPAIRLRTGPAHQHRALALGPPPRGA